MPLAEVTRRTPALPPHNQGGEERARPREEAPRPPSSPTSQARAAGSASRSSTGEVRFKPGMRFSSPPDRSTSTPPVSGCGMGKPELIMHARVAVSLRKSAKSSGIYAGRPLCVHLRWGPRGSICSELRCFAGRSLPPAKDLNREVASKQFRVTWSSRFWASSPNTSCKVVLLSLS